MALQKRRILPASTVVVKALNLWPMCFLSSIARALPPKERTTEAGVPLWFAFCSRLRVVAADDRDRRDVLARRAAEIVRHADARILELARAGAALELAGHLVE